MKIQRKKKSFKKTTTLLPRIGIGYDVHPLVKERKLVLGGVTIPSEKGLLGHSDADVLLHAICDALLGAAALGDIGLHFPNTDERYRNISSIHLLEHVYVLITKAGFTIGNIDAVVVLEKPKVAPYIQTMRETIAHTLKLSPSAVSIKATTNEKLGAFGREEGCAALSTVILFPSQS